MLWQNIKKSLNNPAWVRKALTALLLCALAAVARGMAPEAIADWITVLQPLLVFLGVWAVPNADDPDEK